MLMFWVDEHMNRQCLTALQQDPCIAVLDLAPKEIDRPIVPQLCKSAAPRDLEVKG